MRVKDIVKPISRRTLNKLRANTKSRGAYNVTLPTNYSIKVEEVKIMLLEGLTRAEIAADFGCPVVNLTDHIQRAKVLILQELDDKRDFYYAKALKSRDVIRDKALASGKLQVALNAEIDKAKLLGLYPTVLDSVGNVENISLVFQLKGSDNKPEENGKIIEGEIVE